MANFTLEIWCSDDAAVERARWWYCSRYDCQRSVLQDVDCCYAWSKHDIVTSRSIVLIKCSVQVTIIVVGCVSCRALFVVRDASCDKSPVYPLLAIGVNSDDIAIRANIIVKWRSTS